MRLNALAASLGRFFSELLRRKVLRVASLYVVTGWIALQVALALQSAIDLPAAFSTVIVSLLIVGLPVALVVSWFFDFTPEGIKRTATRAEGALVKPQTTDWILIGLLVIVAGVTILQAMIPRDSAPAATAATAEAPKSKPEPPALGDKSIAVLPFANLSPDKENEYFADGLTEELLNLLAKIGDLKVISRTSSFAFKGTNTPLPEIAKQLGVRHILEGSVRTEGEELRVVAQLIDVSTDTHLWTETYERKIENIFALQDEIAREIAGALKIEVALSSEGRDVPTKNLQAYRLYLQGLKEYRQRDAPPAARVTALFTRAVTLDPNFAEAHAALAAGYFSQLNVEPHNAKQWAALARASAQTALRLKPKLGFAYAVLGVLDRGEFKWESAVENARRSIALDPSNSFAHFWLGTTLARLGYTEAAAGLIDEARRVDPLHGLVSVWPMIVESARGNGEAAKKIADALAESPRSYAWIAHAYLATWAHDRGDAAKAELHYRRSLLPKERERPFVAAVVKALHSIQAKDAAVKALEAEAVSNPSFEPIYSYLLLNADDAIIRLANNRILSGDTQRLVYNANFWYPRHRALRNNPRFKDVLRKMGYVAYWKKHGWPDRCRAKGEDDFECS